MGRTACTEPQCLYSRAIPLLPLWAGIAKMIFYVHWSVHRESTTVQQNATIYSLLYFRKLLYMFRVVTQPIIRNTYNCNYSIWHWSNRLCYLPLLWSSSPASRYRKLAETVRPVTDAVITVVCAPDDGLSYHPKHVEQFTCI
jgi:hypothetical protein